jgi:hypothetical protein
MSESSSNWNRSRSIASISKDTIALRQQGICAESAQICGIFSHLKNSASGKDWYMAMRRITLADAANVTGMTRHQLRNLLNEIPEFKDRRTRARVANTYSKQDLIVIAVCAHLELKLGLRREVIGPLSSSFRDVLLRPRPIDKAAYLMISLDNEVRMALLAGEVAPKEGIILNLGPLLGNIENYLLDEQRTLALSPVAIGQEFTAHSSSARAQAAK